MRKKNPAGKHEAWLNRTAHISPYQDPYASLRYLSCIVSTYSIQADYYLQV